MEKQLLPSLITDKSGGVEEQTPSNTFTVLRNKDVGGRYTTGKEGSSSFQAELFFSSF